MKLAFFTSIVPDGNPTTGFEIANDAIVSGMRDLGHQVVVFGFKLPRQAVVQTNNNLVVLGTRELENSSTGTFGKLIWLLQAMRHGLPFAAAKLADFSTAGLDAAIDRAGPFDGYVLNSYQMAAAFPQLCDVPHIYVAHNVEHQSARQNADAVKSSLESWLYQRDAKLLEPLEKKLTQGANFVWSFSADDIAEFDLPSQKGCFLPLFIPDAQRTDEKLEKSFDVGLIGTWSWQPNFVGLKWFVEEVGPLLPLTMKIAVAGSVPNKDLGAGRNFQFLGRVGSATAFLESVHIVPLVSRGGTGVQLKTIEAFQAGYPSVATSSSVRGVDSLPSNCLVADEPQAFADALIDLVNQSKSGQLPAVDGRQFYARQKTAMTLGLEKGISLLA